MNTSPQSPISKDSLWGAEPQLMNLGAGVRRQCREHKEGGSGLVHVGTPSRRAGNRGREMEPSCIEEVLTYSWGLGADAKGTVIESERRRAQSGPAR